MIGRGRGIELGLALAPVGFARRQPRFGFVARQPLVLQHDGHGNLRFDRARERLDDLGLIGWRSVEAARPADHDGFEPIVFVRERGRFP